MPSVNPYYQSGVPIPLFAGTENAEAIFLRAMEKMAAQNLLAIKNPLWQWLKTTNRIKYTDDLDVYRSVPLLTQANSTVQWYTGYDDALNVPQDSTHEAKFMWGNLAGTQLYNREEILKTGGSEGKLGQLVEDKTTALETTMTNLLAAALMGSQDADGRTMMGLGRVMTVDATCGGIDPTQPGFAYWNPQQMLKASSGTYALATELMPGLRRLKLLCAVDGADVGDCFVCGADVFEALQAYYDAKVMYQPGQGDKRHDPTDPSGEDNMKGLWFTVSTGDTYIYEPSLAAKAVYLLNWRHLDFEIHSGTNFAYSPWESLASKVAAKKRNCLLSTRFTCQKRNYQGVGLFT